MSLKKHEILQAMVEDLLYKRLVKESLSPYVVPTLLVPKKDGPFRICVHSRAINKITVKYKFLIPRLKDMLNNLNGFSIFSKLDLRCGYHHIMIKSRDEW